MNKEVNKINFQSELESVINKHSQENESNTPDFILAQYMSDCLNSYNTAVKARDKWYSYDPCNKNKS